MRTHIIRLAVSLTLAATLNPTSVVGQVSADVNVCSVLLKAVEESKVDIKIYDSICTTVDRLTQLKLALRTGNAEELERLTDRKDGVDMSREALADLEVSKSFALAYRSAKLRKWLTKMVGRGLDLNFEIRKAPISTTLLGLSLAAPALNVELSTDLLELGANPYQFDDPWGQETRNLPSIIPWAMLREFGGEARVKLSKALISAGVVAQAPESFGPRTEGLSQRRLQAEHVDYLEQRGVNVPTRSGVCQLKKNMQCQKNPKWCKLAGPGGIGHPKSLRVDTEGWYKVFSSLDVLRFIGEWRGRGVYLIRNNSYQGRGLGILIAFDGFERFRIYAFSQSGSGLGHCLRLREAVAGLPPTPVQQAARRHESCWRREEIELKQIPEKFHVQDYSVPYIVTYCSRKDIN